MRKARPVPLFERETADIQKTLAAYFDVPADEVRITRAKLADDRQVAYIRVVWPPAKEKRRG